MFAWIQGTVLKKTDNIVLLKSQDLGYELHLLPKIAAVLDIDAQISFYCHTIMREDSWTIYGFEHLLEKKCFVSLIGVSGVGPKMALSLLSHFSLPALFQAVLNEDKDAFLSISGIGKKTAERLVIELKHQKFFHSQQDFEIITDEQKIIGDLRAALGALGFQPREIQGLLQTVTIEEGKPMEHYLARVLSMYNKKVTHDFAE